MEAIANKNLSAVEGYDRRAMAKDGGEGVVTHSDSPARDRIVRDECGLIREHVVGGASVGDQEGCRRDGIARAE